MTEVQKMKKALSEYVIPKLSEKGFEGDYPHYKRVYDNRIELLVFQANKWGNSFTVEISTVFLTESERDSNFFSGSFEDIKNVTVWNTNIRYRLKGMFDGWFYYTDVYKQKNFYNAVSQTKAKTYVPSQNEKLVWKADEEVYFRVCQEVNRQIQKAFKWWDAFSKNQRLKMKLFFR